ncbi:hypothetical protein [Frondihabitans sp. Leaf304]|uniref:hypothetical protein n=1 Tax=Frondihabitans sp. Leaf304 TaxID=1736329 RepID=UPI00138EE94D|nr:hypothetical protein [Frondihabitans sp. Leaf304]
MTVAWAALLSLDGTEWHGALDTAILNGASGGVEAMEIRISQASPAILIVSYMAINHEQIVSDRHLETLLASLTLTSLQTLMVVACGRVPRGGKKVAIQDVRDLLNDQGFNAGSERMAYRFPGDQQLSDEARKLITQQFARLNPPATYVPASIGTATTNDSPAFRAESGLN